MNRIEQEPPPGPKQNFEVEKNSSKLKEKGEASFKENDDSRIEDKNEDSDSGLDSCSIDSQRNLSTVSSPAQSPRLQDKVLNAESMKTKALNEKVEEIRNTWNGRRRRVPRLGVSALNSKPKSISALREATQLSCVACSGPLIRRQPLIKTNGILFLKTREKEELLQRGKPYQNVEDCAMTRSNVVADWTLDLRDHQDFCDQEIEANLRYKLKSSIKSAAEDFLSSSGISSDVDSSLKREDSNFSKNNSSRASTRFQKVAERVNFSEKLKKMKQKFTKSNPKNPFEIKEDFTPPPSAAPKQQPKSENLEGLKLSVGQQQSRILRLHCEQCVLKDKPQNFQSVLFVCQL